MYTYVYLYTHKYTHTHIHTHGDREARASGSLSSAAMRTMRVRVRTNERGEVDGCDHEEGAEFVELPRNPAPVSGFCVCAVGRAIQPILILPMFFNDFNENPPIQNLPDGWFYWFYNRFLMILACG